MTDSHIYFLSGLPRTGSTLLGSILNQNPEIRVTPTSPLYSFMVVLNEHLNYCKLQHTFDAQKIGDKIYRSLVSAFYGDRDRPIVFDKGRAWPKHVNAIREYVNPNVRIICTIRPITEIITSYLKLADKDPDNFIDKHLRGEGRAITNEARAHLLWTNYLNTSYEAMSTGLRMYSESLLLVNYDMIVGSPDRAIESIYRFCGLPRFNHRFDSINNTCDEAKDETWGLKGLHTIRPNLKKTSADPYSYLPVEAIKFFSQFDLDGHGD